jgi:hypothetical protein
MKQLALPLHGAPEPLTLREELALAGLLTRRDVVPRWLREERPVVRRQRTRTAFQRTSTNDQPDSMAVEPGVWR